MRNGIKDKVVAVTGASSGIGEAIAELLSARGAKLVLGARREDKLEELAKRISDAGGEVTWLKTDVRQREDTENLATLAETHFGRLDVMINNAGVSQLSNLEELDVAGWEEMIDINFKGVLYGIAAALPLFKRQGSGHVINIISTAGIKITPTMGVYAATKNAVRTVSEALRQESEGRWRVTGISPGFVKTPFADSMKNEHLRSTIQEKAREIAIPAEAIAEAVAFAIEQSDNVDVGDIVIRPSAQD
ncbi:SDR family oxidoreductase [Pararcticibacter amylolyticus]|uniref:Oxidoreductase n=1 Tax=Pararcticibacter amylolyticus TaxID=2173175 RepID=A0A2U2PM18_9SPHI|nr:SDR family oxidoreductase [Pararcticibacter amylolyticus]PWG82440.1 oxidoreductase [Pararcticibacter amylolyticus]